MQTGDVDGEVMMTARSEAVFTKIYYCGGGYRSWSEGICCMSYAYYVLSLDKDI
jgi:hypothetical protein